MFDIGNRIRQLRIKNDLTLQELASRTELTKGFLSQLERNLTSPSLQTLEDIAEALGVTMSEFFNNEKEEKIIFTEEDAFIAEEEGRIIHWIVPNAQKNAMEPIILELSPQAESEMIRQIFSAACPSPKGWYSGSMVCVAESFSRISFFRFSPSLILLSEK